MSQQTLTQLLPLFIKNLKEKGRSPSTILAYRADIEQLIAFFGERNKALPENAQAEDIEAFRDTLLAKKYTAKSVSRKLNAIKTFFRWLLEDGYLEVDPSIIVSHPKIEQTAPKFLSPLEYRALRDVVREDVRIATIVELIIQAGLRISEVASLKMPSVKSDQIKVEAYASQPERNVPLNRPAQEALQRYLTERPKTESLFVFVSKNGKPLAVRNIRAAIDRFFQKAEMGDYSVNDLRTTFLVENLKSGVDLVLLSHIAGHRRLSTTERYLTLAEVKEPGSKQLLEEL